MQKKLIALAVAAAFSAPAFADVTVYGIVDAAVANVSVTGMKSDLTVISGGLSTSRLGVVAAEDLDNGMKAIAKVEYKLDVADGVVNAGPGIGNARQEMLALAGGFGTVAAMTAFAAAVGTASVRFPHGILPQRAMMLAAATLAIAVGSVWIALG